jgi:hypothetical protein
MTKKTENLYFILWSKAWRAHWTGEKGGEILSRPDRPALSEMREQVLGFARRMAARNGSGITADMVRHACHVVAIGKDLGHRMMTHKQVTQVLAVFRQLAGIDLSAMATTEAGAAETSRYRSARTARAADPSAPLPYPLAAREAALAGIERLGFSDDYIGRITGDRWKTANWRSLDSTRLTQLLMTLKARSTVRAIADGKRTILTGGL